MANEVSDDEFEAEDQKAVASTIILQQREQKLSCAQSRQLGHWKGGHDCLAKVMRINWARGSSKLVGELCLVSFVWDFCTSVILKLSRGSRESISYSHAGESDVCRGYVL